MGIEQRVVCDICEAWCEYKEGDLDPLRGFKWVKPQGQDSILLCATCMDYFKNSFLKKTSHVTTQYCTPGYHTTVHLIEELRERLQMHQRVCQTDHIYRYQDANSHLNQLESWLDSADLSFRRLIRSNYD